MTMRALWFLLVLALGCRVSPVESPEGGARGEDGGSEVGNDVAVAPILRAGSGAAPRRRHFISLEYDPFRADGAGSISGQAFLRTRGGDVKFGAGCLVHLMPVTTYSEEWFEREILGGEALEPADPRADHFHWTTRADGFGGFLFQALPAGDYYLACRIVWDVRDGRGGFVPAGGWAYARTKVGDGETRAVVTR